MLAVELARSSPDLWAKLNPSRRRRSETERLVKAMIRDAAKRARDAHSWPFVAGGWSVLFAKLAQV